MRPRPCPVRFSVFAFLSFSSSVAAATLNVPADYSTIQGCIEAAVSGVDECIVAPGTYHETIDFLGKAIAVRSSGGAEVTTINATGVGGTVVTCISHEQSDTILEGFTLTGGTGSFFAGKQAGGGMLTFDSSPTVVGCTFYANTAMEGAGIYNHVFGNPTVVGCTFISNSAHIGGGMLSIHASPTVEDCLFYDNHADSGGGGGMANHLYSDPIVTECTFRENSGSLGGGMYNDWDANPMVTDCTFERNTAFAGGAIYNLLDSYPQLTRVTFTGNTAGTDGGGIYNSDASGTLFTDCLFVENRAGGNGGALFNDRGFSIADQTFARCRFRGNTAASGGGIYNAAYNTVKLTECSFESNVAGTGGGVFMARDVRASFTDCAFTGNRAVDGGAVYHVGNGSALTRCTFERNNAENRGGGIFQTFEFKSSSGPRTMMKDCSFTENEALVGGGLYDEVGALRLTGSTFQRNAAQEGGGLALYNDDNELTDCHFSENTAVQGGGGMLHYGGDSAVTDSTFIGNAAYVGGGLYDGSYSDTTLSGCLFQTNSAVAGGAMFTDSYSSLTVQAARFHGNRAANGGAVFNLSLNGPTFMDCLFVGNTAAVGGAMYNISASVSLSRSTLAANAAFKMAGAIYGFATSLLVENAVLWENGPDAVIDDTGVVGTLSFSDVQDGLPEGMTDGGGNLDLNPAFMRAPSPGPDGLWDTADDDFGDLRLRSGSPCIDAGDPGFVPEPSDRDLDGHARVLCGRLDMGAYESGIGDADCDHAVNLTDLAAWEACIGGPLGVKAAIPDGVCASLNFDGDGDVDLVDFQAWQRAAFMP